MSDPLTFAQGLLARGIEIVLRGNRLWVWPGKAYKLGLTDAERAYIHEHKAELKELARAKVLPETTVTWTPPTAEPPSPSAEPTPQSVPVAAVCSYCAPHPCVGEGSPYFSTLHYDDPREVARRDAEATRVMRRQLGRSVW